MNWSRQDGAPARAATRITRKTSLRPKQQSPHVAPSAIPVRRPATVRMTRARRNQADPGNSVCREQHAGAAITVQPLLMSAGAFSVNDLRLQARLLRWLERTLPISRIREEIWIT
ncbi:hypothetical protein Bxe_B0392 [Paraburkholderia xenovorans LB400]|uniref:Uncharacterized protein n=1 Tax=Paraburkholderia xenovorans (strain LB400) TaxID=266265 RepID=Q13K35_PARXL|nr:hypothetical protein Bxe_B0392 [Paraburkholderia xenovorans LB400]